MRKPNIIYILADDLGYGDLGCYGQKVIQTPNLDRMAAEGLRFTQHYSGSTVCAPSRSALLQGRHTGHVYVRGNGSLQMRRDPLDPIFPAALQEAGYHTALIGKSGLGCNTNDAALVLDKGFDYFFGFTSHTAAHFYYPDFLWRNTTRIKYPNNTLHKGDHYSATVVTGEALDYLEKQKEGPFFLHLALQIPHASLRAREEWKNKYRPVIKEKPLPKTKQKQHYSYEREPKTTFAAMISHMDHNIGLVLKKLEELDLAKDTLVIFSSDNGAMQEGGHRRDSFQSSGALRGGKRDLHEGGIRVPMIAWWPGKVPAGRVDDQPWAFWDLMPTFVEMSGAKLPQGYETDGLSLANYLKGGKSPQRDYFYWELHESGRPIQAARFGDWKAVRNGTNKPIEIYDLAKDPGETTNLAKAKPALVKKAEAIFAEAHQKDPEWPLTGPTKAQIEEAQKAWAIKRKRDKSGWIPPQARPLD
jgi:arylsulfatase A-like enzyme